MTPSFAQRRGPAADRFERNADAVAEQVVSRLRRADGRARASVAIVCHRRSSQSGSTKFQVSKVEKQTAGVPGKRAATAWYHVHLQQT
jgi:hypothetical protein